MLYSELKSKEVINIKDCKRLGFVCDIEFDCKTGQIEALIIPGPGKFCGLLGRESTFIIPWKSICQIGDDIILVEIEESKCTHKE